jgi:hypothetical protein
MTLPREVRPGRTYFMTRRCTQRQYLLRPDDKTNQALLYCLAVAVERYEMDLYWLGTVSNHYHDGIGDPLGHYPEFIAYFHRLVAKVLNARWGRWENFWASEQTNVVELLGPEDSFGRMIYSLGNPVLCGLVDKVVHWPGASSLVAQLSDKPLKIRRPKWFFREEGDMPQQVELRFKRLPGFEHLSRAQWRDRILAAIAEQERKAARRRRAKGMGVVGRRAILRQSPFGAPRRGEPRRGLRPRVACRNKWLRMEALQRNAEFLRRYREAYRAFRAGRWRVAFPAGTYQLSVLGQVRTEPPPPS